MSREKQLMEKDQLVKQSLRAILLTLGSRGTVVKYSMQNKVNWVNLCYINKTQGSRTHSLKHTETCEDL